MRQDNHKKGKNYFWLVVFCVLFWLLVVVLARTTSPDQIRNFLIPGIFLPMTIALSVAIFLTLSILMMSARRAFRWSGAIVAYLLLRANGLGIWLNGVLIIGIMIVWEVLENWPERDHVKDEVV